VKTLRISSVLCVALFTSNTELSHLIDELVEGYILLVLSRCFDSQVVLMSRYFTGGVEKNKITKIISLTQGLFFLVLVLALPWLNSTK